MVLPCGIGDIFYVLLPVCDWIVPCIVDEIKLRHNVKFHLVSAHEMIGYTEWHSTKDIGKTIFRTKEDANKVAAERRTAQCSVN